MLDYAALTQPTNYLIYKLFIPTFIFHLVKTLRIGTFDTNPGDLACRAVPRMPATAAVLDTVRKCEELLGFDHLVEMALADLRFVTACNSEIIGE